jgi:hypothetical protein
MRDHVFLGASFLHRAPDEPWKAQRGGWDHNVLWGSDYPHTEGALIERGDGTSTIRTSLAWIFSGTGERTVRRIAGKTTAELYGMDYSALEKVAARIIAPTIEDLAEAPAEGDIPDYWDGDD